MARSQRRLIFSSQDSQIYRVPPTAKRGPFIMKRTTRMRGSLLRTADETLRMAVHLPVPPLIAVRTGIDQTVVVYADVGLVDVDWHPFAAEAAVQILAALHETADLTFPTGQSHTPPVQEIVAEVLVWPRVRTLFADQGLPDLQAFVQRMLGASTVFLQHLQSFAAVPCHGDAHSGNFLRQSPSDRLYLIDWEFAHMDVPFFDLYQFLDATSPLQPLVNLGNRRTLLWRYWQGRAQQMPFLSFYQMYLEYAMWHHVWILNRIESDLQSGRFPRADLVRQSNETVAALCNMSVERRNLD